MNKKKNWRGLIFKLAIAACVVVMLVSGGLLLKNMLEDKKGTDTYSALEQYLAPPPETQEVETANVPEAETVTGSEPSSAPEEPTAGEEEQTETAEPEDSGSEPVYVSNLAPDYWPVVDFEGLAGVNEHIVAWILSPGTNINYPVVQGPDNDYYLTHLFTGESSKAGAIFMDYRNHSDLTHRNTIIYGHHMRNRSMFWSLTQYRSQSYYDDNPALRLVTKDGNYELQVVASYVASVEDNAWRVGFENSGMFLEWVEEAKGKSDVSSSVEVTENDRVVTLSTCTYEFSNARYIVLCKLVAV